MDLSAAKDDSNSEVQAKVRLAREKELLQTEHNELKERLKVGVVYILDYEPFSLDSAFSLTSDPLYFDL